MGDEEMLEGAGKVWVALGRAYLRKGGKWALSPSFQAYQEALEVLPLEDVEDAGLWYGIAVMYEAFGSWELAAEAHTAVLRNADDHNLRSVVLFRLGTLFRLLGRHEDAHDCFDAIKDSPPSPLSRADVLFQIALIYEDSGGVHDAIKLYSHITTHLFPHHAPSLAKLAIFHALHVLTSEPSGQSTPQIESMPLPPTPTSTSSWPSSQSRPTQRSSWPCLPSTPSLRRPLLRSTKTSAPPLTTSSPSSHRAPATASHGPPSAASTTPASS